MIKLATKKANGAMAVVKGGASPLTQTQRELVGMFVDQLRALPKYDGRGSANRGYRVVLGLLAAHFETDRPATLQDGGARFVSLLEGAANPEASSAKLAAYEEMKRAMAEMADLCRSARAGLGLPPEDDFCPRPTTPIERAAELTCGTGA